MILPNFPKKCMKLRKFGPLRAPPLRSTTGYKYLLDVTSVHLDLKNFGVENGIMIDGYFFKENT